MLRTIAVGSFSSVQGVFERFLPNGRMVVRVGSTFYEGTPV